MVTTHPVVGGCIHDPRAVDGFASVVGVLDERMWDVGRRQHALVFVQIHRDLTH